MREDPLFSPNTFHYFSGCLTSPIIFTCPLTPDGMYTVAAFFIPVQVQEMISPHKRIHEVLGKTVFLDGTEACKFFGKMREDPLFSPNTFHYFSGCLTSPIIFSCPLTPDGMYTVAAFFIPLQG